MNIKLNNQLINLKYVCYKELLKQNNGSQWWLDIINFLQQWSNNSEIINIQTSGSTGKPKVITVQKKYLIASAQITCDFFQLNKNSTGLLCLSTNYIAGKMMLIRAIVSGMNLICVAPSQNPIKVINQKIDFAAMVSYQVQHAIETPEKFSLIHNLIIGGGQVSNTIIQKLKLHTTKVFETFGMTETLSHIALKEIAPNQKDCFHILNGINIEKGKQNELIINAPDLGVKNLITNDIIELLSNNNFIWKGRLDFIINSGGIKISPEDIEEKIAHLIAQRYCIIGLPDEKLGEKIILIIEGSSFDTKILIDDLKALLPSYFCPKDIKFIEKLPITKSGKIKRHLTRKIRDLIIEQD